MSRRSCWIAIRVSGELKVRQGGDKRYWQEQMVEDKEKLLNTAVTTDVNGGANTPVEERGTTMQWG